MRGRYSDGDKTEQRIEVRCDEASNAITTVQKDSLIIEYSSINREYIVR